ncbi:PREDICTED: uncharacterized protein LOC109462749 [Branchiostoma belcheri]|uniref:Uncharacterized protein LOC109462749 n=1 Tax=Branchiostoma belcheri TaxID=7741 RepID=A0A6P4XWG8_BRABE|nr:PREDICTED: uncharacterized protein LOC109462749 [Branchiostoma belcheri]
MFGCHPFYKYGESCEYRCYNEGGYAMEVSGDRIRTCVKPGEWSGTDLVCECKEEEECCRPDIIFVLDYSGSVSDSDFQQVKDFVASLVDQFGDLEARVGVLRYNHGQMLEFHLNAYSNKPPTLLHINGMPITTTGGTLTGAALSYVANTMLLPGNGNRADAADVVIVLTDGFSGDSVTGPASVLHSMGVQTFAIGVGSCVSDAQLHDIANCDDHVYKLADFRGLENITAMVHDQICCDEPRRVCRYQGCFADKRERKFPHVKIEDREMTNALCCKHCHDKGFPYSATEFGKECHCGTTANFDDLDPPLPNTLCNMLCPGNQNEDCGAHWKMSVYSTIDDCPEDYERVTANGPCLRFSTDRQTYQQARDICQAEGARLVVIKSAVLDAAIDNRIQTTYAYETWIGLDDLTAPASQYVWSDGSVLGPGDYSDWSTGQPDTIYGEKCVEIRPWSPFNYRWNNHFGYILKNYICEIAVPPHCCPRPPAVGDDPGYACAEDHKYRPSPQIACRPVAEEIPAGGDGDVVG